MLYHLQRRTFLDTSGFSVILKTLSMFCLTNMCLDQKSITNSKKQFQRSYFRKKQNTNFLQVPVGRYIFSGNIFGSASARISITFYKDFFSICFYSNGFFQDNFFQLDFYNLKNRKARDRKILG